MEDTAAKQTGPEHARVLMGGDIQREPLWSERGKKKENIPCIELFDRRSLLIILNPPDARVRIFAQTVTINSPYIPRVEGSTCYLS